MALLIHESLLRNEYGARERRTFCYHGSDQEYPRVNHVLQDSDPANFLVGWKRRGELLICPIHSEPADIPWKPGL